MGTLVILFRFRLVALRHDPSEPSNLKEEEEEGMGKEGKREKKHWIRERKRKKREGEREGGRGEVGREETYVMVSKFLPSSKRYHTVHQTMIKTVTTVQQGDHNSQSWSRASLVT